MQERILRCGGMRRRCSARFGVGVSQTLHKHVHTNLWLCVGVLSINSLCETVYNCCSERFYNYISATMHVATSIKLIEQVEVTPDQ